MTDYKKKIAIVFPGGGSQYAGMGARYFKEYNEAREVFLTVDNALDFKLSKLMFCKTSTEINLPENLLPAIFTVSMAIASVIEKQSGLKLSDIAYILAGHCIGEYAALCAAGSLDFLETVKFLRTKGKIIQDHVPKNCSMAAIFANMQSVNQIIASVDLKGMFCQVTNDNASEQVVICGHNEAVALVLRQAKKQRICSMNIGEFKGLHSSLMKSAIFPIKRELQNIVVKPFSANWITNRTAKPLTSLTDERLINKVRIFLSAHTTRGVRWREILKYMADNGISLQVECGSGKVLTNIRMRDGGIKEALALDNPDNIGFLLDILNSNSFSRPIKARNPFKKAQTPKIA